jgi:hypothetical protein
VGVTSFFATISLCIALSSMVLQLAVLILKRPQSLGVRYIEAAVLGLPFVESGTAYAQSAPVCDNSCAIIVKAPQTAASTS